MFKKFKSKIKNHNSGMTLVELMVVLAIFAIISGITMVDYSSFKSSASLNNLANDIALSIRKAQSYAIGAKGNKGVFTHGYGVYFNIDTDNNDSFIIFIDKNDDKIYTSGGSCGATNSECLEELSINSGDRIYQLRSDTNNTNSNQTDLSIFFRRPNLEASFTPFDNSTEIAIVLKDSKGNTNKFIGVSKMGQIRVGNY